jgi:putative pyruvate formate lyase activating enzyme
MLPEEVISNIISLLEKGCKSVGFVSPTHFIPHVKVIIDALRFIGYNPVFVYNSNGYDKVEELKGLESYIDVYLPDFKYADRALAKEYSGAEDYPTKVIPALKEMFRQKGSTLIMDELGIAEKGLIIRHLILPGNLENSFKVLEQIADEISVSVAISLMSQFAPIPAVTDHPKLGRKLSQQEYDAVVEKMEELGFYRGWVQQLESSIQYMPDFKNHQPFGNN